MNTNKKSKDFLRAKLCYEGERQCADIYAESIERLKEMALFAKNTIASELGADMFAAVYPNNKSWTVFLFK